VTELADTSVWARKSHPDVRDWFVAAVEAGDVAACDMVALELLHSARSPAEFAALELGLAALPWAEMDAAVWRRAREVYRALGARPGMIQRSVKHADVLIAAAAELAGMTLLHYDADYETIARLTGQTTRWAAPRGSL
jgi:predicted nucleic acid-binding protein